MYCCVCKFFYLQVQKCIRRPMGYYDTFYMLFINRSSPNLKQHLAKCLDRSKYFRELQAWILHHRLCTSGIWPSKQTVRSDIHLHGYSSSCNSSFKCQPFILFDVLFHEFYKLPIISIICRFLLGIGNLDFQRKNTVLVRKTKSKLLGKK